MCDRFHHDRSGSYGLIDRNYDSHLRLAKQLLCNWRMGGEGSKQDSNPATFVLKDAAHVRKALRILMLGHAEVARSSAATRPSMWYYNKSPSYGYQQAQRHLCLFQSQVKLQGRRGEVLDKNVQFILREIKET